jgi:glycosyltransferase involved in cell wall biosynthesis
VQLFIDDEIFHRHRRGGVSRYLCELAQAAARQPETRVVLFGGWCQSQVIRTVQPGGRLAVEYRPRDSKLRLSGVAWLLSTPWRRRSFARALRADPATLYHPGLYAYDTWIAKRAAGLVVTVHDMQLEIQGTRSRSTRRQVSEKAAIAAVADRIFCVSDSTRRDLEERVPAAVGRTTVVHLGGSLAAPARPMTASIPYFLMVGGRHGHKNGRLAFESFAAIAAEAPAVRLRLCGGEAPGSHGELEFPGAERVRERIDWIQPDDRSLAEAYSGAVGLLYPSGYEGFGLPVLEAMVCGCPVITTNVSSLPEVGGEAALYIQPGDGARLTAHMRRLLSDPGFRAMRIEEGRRQAAKFSWDSTAAAVVSVCREIVAGR